MPNTDSHPSRNPRARPCIGGISYAFPSTARTVRELAAAGLLQSEAHLLEEFGFGSVHVGVEETPYDLAFAAASELLRERGVDPESVGLLVYGGPPGITAFSAVPTPGQAAASVRGTERFHYPATRLQWELGLENATVLGVEQMACTTLFGAVRVARALCLAEGIERALCVMSEFHPAEAGREAIYNCTSDAACAVLVEREGERNRLVASTQVTKGYYWNADALRNEVVAGYFPTAKHVMERTLKEAGWRAEEVDWVIPHNVSLRSWRILLGLVRLPNARLWDRNVALRGHTLAGDNFVNLSDALRGGEVEPGQKLLLFSYGYGAHWTALAVEA
jgi:3-oxoacyl-[acyl-carrier-protein] synthase-3